MNAVNRIRPALMLTVLIAVAIPAEAAQPPAGSTTLWSFLGIPQGINKIRDAAVNRRGNLPGMERTPPLKAIADPANLESDSLAIKTAAKVKQQEDLAPQKIKALKYLAGVGCACYPDVGKALQAGLMDCTADVRYEAANAISEAAGNPCQICESSCCAAEIMTKLRELAYQQDEQCCYKEPSARVRKAAAEALKACRRKHPPGPAPREPEREVPKELPPAAPLPTPAVGGLPPGAPMPGSEPHWIRRTNSGNSRSIVDSRAKTAAGRIVSPVGWDRGS